jgi:hypothetical protein
VRVSRRLQGRREELGREAADRLEALIGGESPQKPSRAAIFGLMSEEPTDETIAFLFDLARETPDRVIDQLKSLQGRVTQSFTTGTVLIAFAAFATVPGSHLTHATLGALAMAGLSYVVLTVIAILTLLPSWGYGLPAPPTLWNDYRTYKVRSIQEAFIERLRLDWPTAKNKINDAKWASRIAVLCVVAEVIALAVGLVLSRVNT